MTRYLSRPCGNVVHNMTSSWLNPQDLCLLQSNAENFENFYKNLIFIGKRFCRQQNCNVQILFSQEDDSITTKMTSV